MTYQPHIDGLRALAVIAVVFYHAGFSSIAGGYLGVDVFFVISGYLVSHIILQEQELNRFSFASFYQRRALRLLPVLFFVLVVTSVFAWRYLLPVDLLGYVKSLLATLGFGSNIWFYFQDNYHAAESAARPLLHTWSLGVEEQFYLLFPALLYLLRNQKSHVKIVCVAGFFVASFLFAVVVSSRYPEASFYLLPTRLWELLAGALLAFYQLKRNVEQGGDSSGVSKTIAFVSFCALVITMIFVDSSKTHPSWVTLLPVLSTVGLLACARSLTIIYLLLSNRLSTYIGRISYSLYLWHFPVFAFYFIKRSGQVAELSEIAEMCAIVIVLSMFSYHLIETPCRRPQGRLKPLVFGKLSSLTAGLLIFCSMVVANNGYPQRLGEIEKIFIGASRDDSFLLKDGRRCVFNVNNTNSCRIEGAGNKSMINMGDSHANAISRPLAEYAHSEGFDFYNMILSHCPYIKDAWRNTGFKAKCETSQMDAVRGYLQKIDPAVIVYMVRFPMYLNSQRFDNGEGGRELSLFHPFYPSDRAKERGAIVPDLIVESLHEMAEMGHTVVLVYPVPEIGWHVPKLIKSKLDNVSQYPLGRKRAAFEKLSITISYDVYKKRVKHTNSILDRVSHPNIVNVYPDKLFCSNETNRCVTHDKNSIFYYDDDHLSQVGAQRLVAEIAVKLATHVP